MLIDTFADRIVGWRVSRSAKTDFVLDGLEQALHDRRPVQKSGLIHHSDRGGQYLSIRYTERLAEAGIEPSVGSVGDSYEFKQIRAADRMIPGIIRTRRAPSLKRSMDFTEPSWSIAKGLGATCRIWKWPPSFAIVLGPMAHQWLTVDWFNNRRLLRPIGNIPPAEAEENFYAQRDVLDMVA